MAAASFVAKTTAARTFAVLYTHPGEMESELQYTRRVNRGNGTATYVRLL
jgi:hypothetical protein